MVVCVHPYNSPHFLQYSVSLELRPCFTLSRTFLMFRRPACWCAAASDRLFVARKDRRISEVQATSDGQTIQEFPSCEDYPESASSKFCAESFCNGTAIMVN